MKCKTCPGEDVGETLCALCVRKKEHCDATRLGQSSKSAVAQHVHDQLMPHEIDWQSMKVIGCACWKRERKIREAFHIENRNAQLNRDGGLDEAPFGIPLFDFWCWPRYYLMVRLSSSSVC